MSFAFHPASDHHNAETSPGYQVAKFRKKPVVIEAVRWNGPEDNDILVQFADHWVSIGDPPHITTLEGSMRVSPGDWVIKGVKNEFYPCKDDIFRATYDQVD